MTTDKGILIKNVYYMLAYSFSELLRGNYEDIEAEKFDDAYDLFAAILCRGVASQLKHGLSKVYVGHKETLPTLRGKLDLSGTMRNVASRRLLLDCEYDELTFDNPFNQIIKATLLALLKCPSVKDEQKMTIKGLLARLSGVGGIDLRRIDWRSLRYDRGSLPYRMLHYLCYFVIENLLLTTEHGGYAMQSFSESHLERIFENFIFEYCRKSHAELSPARNHLSWNVDESASSMSILPIMKTDLILSFPDRKLVVDAKYYATTMSAAHGKNKVISPHLYQIFAYVSNLASETRGVVDGMMLYAKTQEEHVPDGVFVMKGGNVIRFKSLDLGKDFEDVKGQLEDLISNRT